MKLQKSKCITALIQNFEKSNAMLKILNATITLEINKTTISQEYEAYYNRVA